MENLKLLRDVDEVAALLGQTNEYIRNLCRLRKIKASKIGKKWMVPQSEIDRILMIDPSEPSSKAEIIIAKLTAENKAIRAQLEAVKSLLGSANHLLDG